MGGDNGPTALVNASPSSSFAVLTAAVLVGAALLLTGGIVGVLPGASPAKPALRQLARAYALLEGRLHSLRLLRSTPVSLHESTRSALDRWLELALDTARLATLETTHAGRELLERAYRDAAKADDSEE